MSDDPQSRFESVRALDPRVDSPGREGLTGSTPADVYGPPAEPSTVTIPPDQRPPDQQPRWRRDFAIDWPEDHFVARRDFAKFLVLTSGAFAFGQGYIAAKSLLRKRAPLERKRVAALSELAPGRALVFGYPEAHDPCLLIRTEDGELLAYDQRCTHLSCAVIPKLDEGVLHCPCHEGYFDLRTGRNIAGPPPRPLPRIVLEIEGDDVYAVAVERRTV